MIGQYLVDGIMRRLEGNGLRDDLAMGVGELDNTGVVELEIPLEGGGVDELEKHQIRIQQKFQCCGVLTRLSSENESSLHPSYYWTMWPMMSGISYLMGSGVGVTRMGGQIAVTWRSEQLPDRSQIGEVRRWGDGLSQSGLLEMNRSLGV